MTGGPVDEVRLRIAGHVARVTIDRQHVRNAVDERTRLRCNEIWEQIEADPSVRAVIITGAGDRAFCAGADMPAGGSARPASTTGPTSTQTASPGSACAAPWTYP